MDVQIPATLESELVQRWSEPHRRHHDRRHLDEVLAALATLRGAGLEFEDRPVVLAAWFHDAVYAPLSATNEQDSADLARRLLADDVDCDEVARLVEMTQTHGAADDDRNAIALSDADLSVLGADPDRYDEYAAAVRDEFHEVPEELFVSGRREILVEFAARDRLFLSMPARDLWEDRARANLKREIAALS